jgi:hypothetical protein
MRFRVLRTLTLAAIFGLLPAWALGQEAGIPAKLHPWGRFEPGAWKQVQVVTETLDEQGQVVSTSTTDTKTTLVDIDSEGVTLEIQACMEVAGKRFEAEPQTIKQGFYGDAAVPNLKPKEPTEGHVVVEDRQIACKVQQLEIVGPTGKTTTSIFSSMTQAPYVLKRESVSSNGDGKEALNETRVDVLAFDMPVKVLGAIKAGSHVRTVSKNSKGTVTTLAVVLPDVPGGVVCHSSKEVDPTGRILRRSTLELVNYGTDPEKDQGPFNRKRPNRRSKTGHQVSTLSESR